MMTLMSVIIPKESAAKEEGSDMKCKVQQEQVHRWLVRFGDQVALRMVRMHHSRFRELGRACSAEIIARATRRYIIQVLEKRRGLDTTIYLGGDQSDSVLRECLRALEWTSGGMKRWSFAAGVDHFDVTLAGDSGTDNKKVKLTFVRLVEFMKKHSASGRVDPFHVNSIKLVNAMQMPRKQAADLVLSYVAQPKRIIVWCHKAREKLLQGEHGPISASYMNISSPAGHSSDSLSFVDPSDEKSKGTGSGHGNDQSRSSAVSTSISSLTSSYEDMAYGASLGKGDESVIGSQAQYEKLANSKSYERERLEGRMAHVFVVSDDAETVTPGGKPPQKTRFTTTRHAVTLDRFLPTEAVDNTMVVHSKDAKVPNPWARARALQIIMACLRQVCGEHVQVNLDQPPGDAAPTPLTFSEAASLEQLVRYAFVRHLEEGCFVPAAP